jgi:hypothetical protein
MISAADRWLISSRGLTHIRQTFWASALYHRGSLVATGST